MAEKRRRGRPAGTHAAYRGIADKLRDRLTSREWPAGSVLPSVVELAREYRVGRQVVWLAMDVLKQEGRLRANARRRLVATGSQGGHTSTNGHLLQILGTDLADFAGSAEYFMELQRGIFLGAGAMGMPLTIAHGGELGDFLPLDLLDRPLSGIIVVLNLRDKALRAFERLNVPVVLADRPQARWKLHAVSVDNEPASYETTSRLVALGHKRIAFVRNASPNLKAVDPDSIERQAGYLRALQDARLEPNIFTLTPNYSESSASLQSLLRARPRITAAFAVDGGIAETLQTAARAAGRSVPADLSIVCFESAGRKDSEISGMRTDFTEIGRRSVLMLRENRRPPQQQRVMPTWLDGSTLSGPP